MTTDYTPNFGLAMPDFRMGPWHDLINNNALTIDALLFSALSNTNVVAWENDTLYNSGASVVDNTNATIWLCLLMHTSASAPTTFAEDRAAHPDYWTQLIAGFAPRGEWQNNTEYFPYDLTYSTTQGIFALCTIRHTSNVGGTLKDDEAFWAFMFDFTAANIGSALAVTYDNTASGIPATNVQMAIDHVDSVNDTQATQIVALNNVNIAQGDAIATKLSYTEVNTLTDPQKAQVITDIGALSTKGGQTVTGGFRVDPNDLGIIVGPYTPDSFLGNYQYGTNNGAITWNAPTADCAVDVLITNGASAGAITFVGFTYNPTNSGDPFTLVAGHKFLVSIRRINGISTLIVKALQ